jgi:UDP-N-acetylglucosamine 4,6-dehydratase/5-epimerase
MSERAILGRDPYYFATIEPTLRALITGAKGTIGTALTGRYDEVKLFYGKQAPKLKATDLRTLDVRDYDEVMVTVEEWRPEVIFHLAGEKHAPDGERRPWEYVETNLTGTKNILAAANEYGARVVFASTCKAADPETVYGATKLIAERACLEEGHSVARLYNVWPASGNVFETWSKILRPDPLPVTPCARRFMTLSEAVDLFLWVATAPPGRYAIWPTVLRSMKELAEVLYPERTLEKMFPRRGDRLVEPDAARRELFEHINGEEHIVKIVSSHDPS